MKKRLTLAFLCVVCMALLAITASAAAPAPQKPDLGIEFGAVTTIDGFTPPSQLYVGTTERVLLTDGNGNYVTYPTYYVTKDSTTFDFNFNNLNGAQSVQYTKQSVVMLEIPNGVTTISNNYFNKNSFESCISVQFPGTVTSYGSSLFVANATIRVVEFLDGTEPITMGDQMFWDANYNGKSNGTTNLEYVRFPNNLTSIGNSTFGKSHQTKTIILGENLKTIGTSFLSQSTKSGKDTFLYVSDNFFKDTTTMFTNLFGGFDKYHDSYMNIILFYTGTQEQAQAFWDAFSETQNNGYVFKNKNAKFVSASEYDYATHKPTGEQCGTLVYGVSECDAFYSGNHNTESEYVFTSFIDECYMNNVCTRCGEAEKGESFAPIFTYHGYSSSYTTGKICVGYSVNKESLNAYGNDELSYGVVAYAPKAEETSLEPVYVNDGTVSGIEGAVVASLSKGYSSFDFIISGFETEAHYNTALVMCMYIYDGEDVDYVCSVNGEAAQLELAQTVVFTDHVEEAE